MRMIEVGDDLKERSVGVVLRKTARGVLLALASTADKRYGDGKWVWKRPRGRASLSLFPDYICADDGRCLSVIPADEWPRKS